MRLLKKILLGIGLLLICVVIYWFYSFNKYTTLQPQDKTTIMKSFGKDSDNKGYSDEGHKLMKEDLENITNLSESEKKDFEYFYVEYLKQRRITVLAKDQNDFFKELTRLNKIDECMGQLFIWKIKFSQNYKFNLLNDRSYGDKDISTDLDILISKYSKLYDSDKLFLSINPEISEKQCISREF